MMKKSKGITLVALIVTIIVLLILAGVSLNLIMGNEGILGKAESSVNEHSKAEAREKLELVLADLSVDKFTNKDYNEEGFINDKLDAEGMTVDGNQVTVDDWEFEIDRTVPKIVSTVGQAPEENLPDEEEKLPENTPETDAGTEVALKDGWVTESVRYVDVDTGKEIASKQVATVYAVSDGQGNTVPVPLGFYYVGGTLDSGVVISDNEADKNKYAGVADVPAGAIYVLTTGIPKAESALTAEEKKEAILGNQFVWIPISASEYTKKTWGKNANGANTWNATWETQTDSAELPQIQKYGGFYIGRFEAGTSGITLSTGVNFASQNTVSSSWVNDNFSIRDGLGQTATGTITTKPGEIPFYHTDYFTALKLSNSMYQTDYVQSGLITGTMWDAMMKFIAGSDDTIVTKSTWGNYTDGSVTYVQGQGMYATVNSSNGAMTSKFTPSDGSYHYGIKTTAVSEDVKKKNLYDVAGNLWEWTREASYPNNTLESFMLRGGSFYDSYADRPACYRGHNTATHTNTDNGFRPTLYIK